MEKRSNENLAGEIELLKKTLNEYRLALHNTQKELMKCKLSLQTKGGE